MESNSKFKEFLLSKGGYIGMIALFYVVILGIFAALAATNSMIIMWIYIVLFTYFGWQALNRITPEMFLWLPLKGWIIYFIVKFVLSVFIGVFVAPFQIAKKITTAIQENVK